jgi:CHAT domain-containing protein
MNHAELAEILIHSSDGDRQAVLSQNPSLVDTNLAWLLKMIYDDIESSNPASAAEVAAALSSLAGAGENKEIEALAAWTVGMSVLDAGQLEEAVTHLENARTGFWDLGQPLRAANTQVSLLRAFAMLGRFDEAFECGLQARETFSAHGNALATGKIEQNLGNIHFMLDRYGEAEEFYRSAQERYQEVGDQKQLVQIQNNLATVLTSQYRFNEANAIYEQALARAEAAGLEITLAEIETNLGCLVLFQGHYDRALDYLERSRRRYAALGIAPWSAVADQELADAYLELNLVQEAAAIYERVIPAFAELKMPTELARALTYHGRAQLAMGKTNAARSLLARARAIYKQAENTVGEALVTLIEAQAHYAQGEYAAAASGAEKTEEPFASVYAWGRLLMARWLRAEANRAQGNYEDTEKLLHQTLADAEQWSVLPVIHRCHTSLGLLAEMRGNWTVAEAAFKQAIAAIEETRSPLPAEEFRASYLSDKLIPYTELVRLCLIDGTPARLADALGYVERARSRALIDMLAGFLPATVEPRDPFDADLITRIETLREELNWFYNQINRPDSDAASRGADGISSLYEAVQVREAAIAEITLQLRQRSANEPGQADLFDLAVLQAELGAETVLVEYFSLDDNLLAFVVTNEDLNLVQLNCTEAAIAARLRQFHTQLGVFYYGADHLRQHIPALVERARQHLCALYDGLLRPIEERLGERRLVVVPHRALHYVPFHALHDGDSYVIQRREVVCVPSAAVLRHCLSVPHQPLERAVFFGVADERTPRVHEEIQTLATLFPNSVARLDKEATRAALSEYAVAAGVVHLACHGNFRPDNPLFSSLQLGDGWFTVGDAYSLDLSCELVTLSACETGVNALAPGDELVGLARGFFSAGAPSLAVSLWTVNDEATARLMVHFYQRLRAGSAPAAALRSAQCQLMETNPHPFFWAPFVLQGRW